MTAIANIGRKVVAATVKAPEATMLHPIDFFLCFFIFLST